MNNSLASLDLTQIFGDIDDFHQVFNRIGETIPKLPRALRYCHPPFSSVELTFNRTFLPFSIRKIDRCRADNLLLCFKYRSLIMPTPEWFDILFPTKQS
jgi:hypothetical protein